MTGVRLHALDIAEGQLWSVEEHSDAGVALAEWANFHHVPDYIMDGAVIVRDAERCQILVVGWLPPDEVETAPIVNGELATRTWCDQGEAPPLPFPPEVTTQ